MNISDTLNATAANNLASAKAKTSAQATAGLSPVQQSLQKTTTKIQTEVDATSAQLSSFGQLKSAVSNTQLAARALGNLSSSASSADVKTAATQFVSSFNAAIGSAKTAAAVPGAATSADSANRASRDLSRSVMADVRTFDALKKLGFSLRSDGTLALDAKKLEAAQKADPVGVQATLSKIGQQVDKTAAKELASDGPVSGSMAALNARASLLKAQQNSLATLAKNAAAASASTSSSTTNSSSWSRGFGVSAYQANSRNV
jgi:hypothetical protein